jgi:hypothetical protein
MDLIDRTSYDDSSVQLLIPEKGPWQVVPFTKTCAPYIEGEVNQIVLHEANCGNHTTFRVNLETKSFLPTDHYVDSNGVVDERPYSAFMHAKLNKHLPWLAGNVLIRVYLNYDPPFDEMTVDGPFASFMGGMAVPSLLLQEVLVELFKELHKRSPFIDGYMRLMGNMIHRNMNSMPDEAFNEFLPFILRETMTFTHPHAENATAFLGQSPLPPFGAFFVSSREGFCQLLRHVNGKLQEFANTHRRVSVFPLVHEDFFTAGTVWEMRELSDPHLTLAQRAARWVPKVQALYHDHTEKLRNRIIAKNTAEDRKQRHDEREKLEAAIRAAEKAERDARIASERLARLNASEPGHQQALPQVGGKKKAKARARARARNQLADSVHELYLSGQEKLGRREHAQAKQVDEHLQAVAKAARAEADRLAKKLSDAGARAALAEHIVPEFATLDLFVSDAEAKAEAKAAAEAPAGASMESAC